MTEHTRDLLVIKIGEQSAAEVAHTLDQYIEAEDADLIAAAGEKLADVAEIRKLYRLDTRAAKGAAAATASSNPALSAQARHDLEAAILGLIALRGAG